MANKRIYYAVQQAMIEGDGGDWDFDTANAVVKGLQNASVSTNYNLTQAFQLGQQAIYENIEELPDVEVSLSKLLDGSPLMFHLSTVDAVLPTLAGRSNAKCKFGLGIWPDTETSAASTTVPNSVLACSGMYIGSVTYSFPLDDNFTEECTLVGNHKLWKAGNVHLTNTDDTLDWDNIDMAGQLDGNNDSPIGTGGVNRRQDLTFDGTNGTVDFCLFPPDVYGISSSGTNELDAATDVYGAHMSSITISVDFGREQINELGRRGPYHRVVTFPVEVTTEIEVTSISGDMVSATEAGIYGTGTGVCAEKSNLVDRTIRIATCEGTRIYLGTKNKLASVNYSGGDAGGGNVAVTYSFTTFNDFTVVHSGDPNASGSAWWTDRATYLGG